MTFPWPLHDLYTGRNKISRDFSRLGNNFKLQSQKPLVWNSVPSTWCTTSKPKAPLLMQPVSKYWLCVKHRDVRLQVYSEHTGEVPPRGRGGGEFTVLGSNEVFVAERPPGELPFWPTILSESDSVERGGQTGRWSSRTTRYFNSSRRPGRRLVYWSAAGTTGCPRFRARLHEENHKEARLD